MIFLKNSNPEYRKSFKIQIFHAIITKIIKLCRIPRQNNENHENLISPHQNRKNHEIPTIPCQNHANHENSIIKKQNHANHENLSIP